MVAKNRTASVPAYAAQLQNVPYALRVKRNGSGLGVFAAEDIPKDAFIVEYTGELITDAEADKRNSRYLIDAEDDWVIDGAGRENLARYINHRCKPNCIAEADGKHVYIYAKRRIRAGEEIGYNYGHGYTERYFDGGCKCPTCRAEQ